MNEPEISLTFLAQKAYHAYGKTTGFKNHLGLPMPEFADLSPLIQAAWKSTVIDVANRLVNKDGTLNRIVE